MIIGLSRHAFLTSLQTMIYDPMSKPVVP